MIFFTAIFTEILIEANNQLQKYRSKKYEVCNLPDVGESPAEFLRRDLRAIEWTLK